MEAAFTTLAIRVAEGKESEALLQQQRQVLDATRQLCASAYERAFPRSAGVSANAPN